MKRRVSGRARIARPSYAEPSNSEVYRPDSLAERWQTDWVSESDSEEGDALGQSTTSTRQQQYRERKRRRREAETRATEEATAAEQVQTTEERDNELRIYIAETRNQNTHRTYTSGMRQFRRWAQEVENKHRAAAAAVDVDHPREADVAQYARYLVETKRVTMSTVHSAIASIADHVRLIITADYNPCRGPLITQLLHVLVTRATPAQQKTEIQWQQLQAIAELADATGRTIGRRDACMFMLAYHAFLRASEIVRMKRSDITFSTEEVDGRSTTIMKVHVDRLAKNDAERLGHDRFVAKRDEEAKQCMVARMMRFMEDTKKKSTTTKLFQTVNEGPLAINTPRHRLHHWLMLIGTKDPTEFGFHSLRAGRATDAARAGVPEAQIKLHGNWKSDAVRAYIRPGLEERLQASSALGQSTA